MSLNRYAKRADSTQSTIVEGLRKCGYLVICVAKPVDLLVRHNSWPPNLWTLLECKTPNRTGKLYRPRKDQAQQRVFCDVERIPYVTSVEEAIGYLAVRGQKLERSNEAT